MINCNIIVEYLAFLFLMHGEFNGEPLLGQLNGSMVVVERNMEMLDHKQFNCFSSSDIRRFKSAMTNEKARSKIVSDLRSKLSFEQFYFWTFIYVNRDLIRMINFDRRNYYMTVDAWKHVRKKYPKWTKKIVIIDVIGNHIFFGDKKKKAD